MWYKKPSYSLTMICSVTMGKRGAQEAGEDSAEVVGHCAFRRVTWYDSTLALCKCAGTTKIIFSTKKPVSLLDG